MKVVIAPIIRLLGLLSIVFIAYPFVFIVTVVFPFLWDFEFKRHLKEAFPLNCFVGSERDGYYYKTPKDFLLNKKSFF